MRYRPELDGMRAFAVFAVIGSHSLEALGQGGWMGVDVFFVLSGFLISTLLMAEFDRHGRIGLKRFYGRRMLRLYPALLTMILLGFALCPLIGVSFGQYGRAAAASGLYLGDFVGGGDLMDMADLGHTWSLGVEEQFYLLWPLVLILMLRFGRNLPLWTGLATLAGFGLLAVLSFHLSPDGISDWAYYEPWSRFPELLLGCLVAILLRAGRRVAFLESRAVGFGLLGAAAAMLLLGAELPRYPHFSWEAPAIALLAAGLVWHLMTGRTPLRAILGWAPLAWLGRRSYGIYLYQLPVITVALLVPGVRRPLLIAAAALVSVLAAAVSYRFVELPFLRLKSRLSQVPEAAQPDPAPAHGAMLPGPRATL